MSMIKKSFPFNNAFLLVFECFSFSVCYFSFSTSRHTQARSWIPSFLTIWRRYVFRSLWIVAFILFLYFLFTLTFVCVVVEVCFFFPLVKSMVRRHCLLSADEQIIWGRSSSQEGDATTATVCGGATSSSEATIFLLTTLGLIVSFQFTLGIQYYFFALDVTHLSYTFFSHTSNVKKIVLRSRTCDLHFHAAPTCFIRINKEEEKYPLKTIIAIVVVRPYTLLAEHNANYTYGGGRAGRQEK